MELTKELETRLKEVPGSVIDGDVTSNPGQDVTIRLVGGGGTAGITTALLPEDNIDGVDTPKGPSVEKDEKKTEKRKSAMSGLRKLGHLGGLRKNESSGSLKDMV